MCDQQHRGGAVVLIRGNLMRVICMVGRAGVPTATAAKEDPGSRLDQSLVQAAADVLTDEAVEGGVGHAVQGGEQQRQVIVVKYCWKTVKGQGSDFLTLGADPGLVLV